MRSATLELAANLYLDLPYSYIPSEYQCDVDCGASYLGLEIYVNPRNPDWGGYWGDGYNLLSERSAASVQDFVDCPDYYALCSGRLQDSGGYGNVLVFPADYGFIFEDQGWYDLGIGRFPIDLILFWDPDGSFGGYGGTVTATLTYDYVSSVPLPGALPLLGTTLAVFGVLRRRSARGRGSNQI